MLPAFPYTDAHQLNLDWILGSLKNITITQEDAERIQEIYAELGPYVFKTVKTYGAVGDGITDDSTAIQACVDAEDIVIFPPGEYLIENRIITAGPKIFIGYPLATILENNAWFSFSYASNITLKNLIFDSKDVLPTTNVVFYRSKEILVDNCLFITGQNFNVQCSTCGNVTISNCKMLHTVDSCSLSLSLDPGFENTEYGRGGYTNISNCYFKNAGLDGIIANNYHVTISNCIFEGCGTKAPAAGVYCNAKEDIKIIDCFVRDCTGNGLDLLYTNEIIIDNCTIQDSKSAGIYLAECKRTSISNCSSINNGTDPIDSTQNSGIVLTGGSPSDEIYISHCTIKNNAHNGIKLANATNCYIDACYLANNTDGDIGGSGSYEAADYTTVSI